MSTPFQAPDTDTEPRDDHEVYGKTKFTVGMMRSLRWIRAFHGVFGLLGAGLGALSLSCGALSALPMAIGTAPGAPGMAGGFMAMAMAIYVVFGVFYLALAVWLLLGAWHMQRASMEDDATVHVERALQQVVRLWITVTVGCLAIVIGYAAMIGWVVTSFGTLRPPGVPPG